MNHRELRESLGAYTLGLLEPRDRADLEEHLDTCSWCQAEVARLAPLPTLLGRLSSEEVATLDEPLPEAITANAWSRIGRARRRDHLRLWAWRVTAVAAAAAVAVVLVVPTLHQSDSGYPLRLVPAAAGAAHVGGTAEAYREPWGTAIAVDVRGLPPRGTYTLWAIARDGHRETAATWAATADRTMRLKGSCSIALDDMAGYEITAGGEVLARLTA